VKLNDAVWGVLLLVFAGGLFMHVRGFPSIPGQQVGPNALPGALAVGLGVCGLVLLVRGLRARAAARQDGGSAAPWAEMPEWFSSAPQLTGFGVLVGVNLLYLFGARTLGFIITGTVYLAALMWVLRVKPLRALFIGLVMTLVIHYGFYKLLRVPLPWGLLQPIAW
jgi:putative tricarboxylic transport membrane protein